MAERADISCLSIHTRFRIDKNRGASEFRARSHDAPVFSLPPRAGEYRLNGAGCNPETRKNIPDFLS